MIDDRSPTQTALIPPFHCPQHEVALRESADAWECPKGDSFPVRGGLPRFVPSGGYADAFGRQWNRFQRTQLDSHTGLRLTEERVLRCLGLPDDAVQRRELTGHFVLEVGCGAGRFTEILLRLGAHVTSVDLSSAVEANSRNFPPNAQHRIAQADARALPFEPQQFDGVFCLGVVQHTPDPEQTLSALYGQVRPGGWLAIDHYATEAATISWVGMHSARQVFKRLPAERKLPAVERMVDRLLPVHRAVARRSRTAARLLSRVSPVLSFYHLYPQLPEDLQREWAVLDTHDALTDHFKHHRTVGQIRAALWQLGATEIAVARGGNGIEARAERPASDGT